MVLVFNEASQSKRKVNRFGIEVNPEISQVAISLALRGGHSGIVGDTSASSAWGERFYERIRKGIESLGYQVREEQLEEEEKERYLQSLGYVRIETLIGERDLERYGYPDQEEDEPWEVYRLVVQKEINQPSDNTVVLIPVASYGPFMREKYIDMSDLSFGTHWVPGQSHIAFSIENQILFPEFLDALINDSNGVVGERYREFLRINGENPDEVIATITKS